jgi:hypothetical protein
MALNVAQLRGQIQRVFDEQLADKARVAHRIAQVYQQYAVAAQAPPGAPVVLKGSESRMFESSLRTLMQGEFPPAQAAQAIATAISGFWLSPPVMTGVGGVCTAIVPGAAIGKMSATRVDDSGQAAASLAMALDMMTKTIFVINPFPLPPGPLF